mmetsp:Transcript_26012/g.4460  ORF Transcript_26012/g.4460 Transcript_26012/m.4460 type:complete len:94 (-) Transcript_26012:22-303(-)
MPSATQIMNGVNALNMPCSTTSEIPAFSGLKSLSFDKLPAGRNLTVFIAASNTMERYRDVNSEVKAVYFATPILEDDESAVWIRALLLVLLVI